MTKAEYNDLEKRWETLRRKRRRYAMMVNLINKEMAEIEKKIKEEKVNE